MAARIRAAIPTGTPMPTPRLFVLLFVVELDASDVTAPAEVTAVLDWSCVEEEEKEEEVNGGLVVAVVELIGEYALPILTLKLSSQHPEPSCLPQHHL
jgi:hypothetical protein